MTLGPIRSSACALAICAFTWPAHSVSRDAAISLGLPASAPPASPATATLGKELFFDKQLSADGRISCATCHAGPLLFDGLARSRGIGGKVGTRNAPSLLNAAFLTSQFWDGRAATLEQQARMPLLNPIEHGFRSADEVEAALRKDKSYRTAFRAAFGEEGKAMTLTQASAALAAFQRSQLAGDSPFDRYTYANEPGALTPAAQRGLALFQGPAKCGQCHTIGADYSLFTDNAFHVSPLGIPEKVTQRLAQIGRRVFKAENDRELSALEGAIATDAELASLGRFIVTRDPNDIGKFRTPSLRNVELTGPYMHDGSVTSLAQAVEMELYDRESDVALPLVLTPREKADLVEFLNALTSSHLAARPQTTR